MKGKLFAISGPSGVGKNSVLNRVMQLRDRVQYSVSATSRPMRPGEIDGKSYYFVTRAQFEQMIAAGELLEHAEYVGNFYGTPLAPVRDMLLQGRDVLFDIDVQGARQLKASLPEVFRIFILPPSLEELRRRLRKRGLDSEEVIRRRLANACGELREAAGYDALIVNDRLEDAYARLRTAYGAAVLAPHCHERTLRALLEDFA